jgi:hypothetical protein
MFSSLFATSTFAQDSADAGVDTRSFRLGGISSWSEAVRADVKELALSAAVDPAEMDSMIEKAEEIAEGYGVSTYRETDFLITDLFPTSVTEGKHVLFIYKGDTLDRYLALKARKAELVAAGDYDGIARENIAREYGRMLSYSESRIDELLTNSGREVLQPGPRRPEMSGVWKAPTVSLDDPRWRIEDVACLGGCSLVSYNYFVDLLSDPANDERSVVDLYADVKALNSEYVSLITRPVTLQQLEGYDAANDAALDCTPDGDGLQHQLTAPIPIEIEQNENNVVIRYEYWNAVREIHLDREPETVTGNPVRLGYSTGRYNGQTLIVETRNLSPSQISLGGGKFLLSTDTRFIERYTVSEEGARLDVDWTVIDPVNLREPYTGRFSLLSAPDWELDTFDCDAITGEF